MVSFTDAQGRSLSLAWDSNHQVTGQLFLPDQYSALAYNGQGRMVSATDAEGATTTYSYMADGKRLQSITDPTGQVSGATYEDGPFYDDVFF